MPEWLSAFFGNLKQTWNSPRRGRLVALGVAGLLVLAVMGGTFWWASQPDWAPLYSGLSEVEAAGVVAKLEEQKVPFRLSGGGGTVEVPRPELYRLRVKLAAEGGPKPVIPGYELLDQLRDLYSTARVLKFDDRASTAFSTLDAMSLRLGTMDLRIAAIAISNNLILLTRNVADFSRVLGLQTADWTL